MPFYHSVYFLCVLVILQQAVGNRWWNIPTCRVEILTGLSHSIRCEKALDEKQDKSSPNAHHAAEFSIIQDARVELSWSVIGRCEAIARTNFLKACLLAEAVKFRSSEDVRTALDRLIKGLQQAFFCRSSHESGHSANRLVLPLRQLYVWILCAN